MEHKYGDIERERNLNQGKRPDQNEADAKNFIIGVMVIVVIAIGLVIAKSLNLI
mgnify:CR=1 FL=1